MLKVISLYSGAGGIDYGLEAAGFTTAVALDFDKDCCLTLRGNRGWPVIEGAITNVTTKQILKTAQSRVGEIDLLAGGPPCQPFSKAGYWANGDSLRLDDPRATTIAEYLRVLEQALPKTFLLENVEGMSFSGKNEALDLILSTIEKINRKHKTNYRPTFKVVKAAEYGVPQMRSRFIMVGARDGTIFKFPRITHGSGESGLRLKPFNTAWDAIGDVEPEDFEDLAVRGKWADLLPSIPEGNNYLWHTDRGGGLPLFGWRRCYWTFLLKLAKDRPSWTIQAQPGPAVGPFHWENRRLSMRELCRLQTFPDDVNISGGMGAIQKQVGNAVPSLLAEILGREIKTQLLGGSALRRKLTLMPSNCLESPKPERVRKVPKEFLAHGRRPYGSSWNRKGVCCPNTKSYIGLNLMEDLLNHTEVSTPDQSLGSLVTHFPLSEVEKSRINQLISDKGLPREIIVKYCSQAKLFRDEFVKVSIPGFRPVKGQKSLSPQTLKAFCDFLKNPRDRAHSLCWHIYRQCVTNFVQTELSALQLLLTDCNYVDEKVSSHDILQEICNNAFEFGVNEEDIAKLYECVWFERIDDLAELLPLCRKADPVKVQAKQLREFVSSVDDLKDTFHRFKADEKSKNFEATNFRDSTSEKLEALATFQKQLDEKLKQFVDSSIRDRDSQEKLLRERISEQNSFTTIEKSVTELREFVHELFAKNGDRLHGLESNLTAQNDQSFASTSKFQAQLTSIEDDVLALSDRPEAINLESCHNIIDEKLAPLLARQEVFEEALQKTNRPIAQIPGASSHFRSPLTVPVVAGKMVANVVKETDFLRYWGQYLLKHNKVYSPEELVAFHCSFLANNVLIADYDLSSSWLHCLGWERFSMDLVASPAWCEEQDWKDGISHLFTGGKSIDPRVLTLHNYDTGLVDCYLSPTVHLWALKKKNYSQFCKLFLIPADAMSPLTSNVLNHVSVTVGDSCEEWTRLELTRDLGRDFPKSSLQTCVVDPAAVAQWTTSDTIYGEALQSLVNAVKDKLDIKIDSWIYDLCSKTIGECGRFFEEGSAVYVGVTTHVLPWVRQKYGQDDYEMAKQYLLQFLDIRS